MEEEYSCSSWPVTAVSTRPLAICNALATEVSSGFYTRFKNDAIDDGFYGVFLVTFEANGIGKVAHFAVNAGAKALLIQFVEQVFELAFAAADDGRVDNDAFPRARERMRSTICSADWREIGLPHLGQWGTPTEA